MRKVFISIIAISAILSVAGLGSGLIPAKGQICKEDKTTHQEQCTAHNTALVILWHAGEFLEDHGEAVIALFTVVLAISTILLWDATKRLWKSGDENMRVLERAYLGLGPTGIRIVAADRNAPQHTEISITVQNVGRTAAFITKIYGEFSRTPPPDSEKPIYNFQRGASTALDLVIAGGENVPKLPVTFNDAFIDPQFFWGFLEFADIFKQPHTAHFCAFVVPSEGKFMIAGTPAWNGWD